MNAASRDDVFRELRKQGIKAIKVVAADGSKANGEVRGIRRRVLIASIGAVAVIVGGAAFFLGRTVPEPVPEFVQTPQGPVRIHQATSIPRQVIVGSRDRIEKLPEGFFQSKAEAFLARFAEPGRPYSAPECDWPTRKEFEAVLQRPIRYAENDLTEHIDLKRIVTGIKREMREYLRGGGLVSGYIKELIKRQDLEISYRVKADQQIKSLLSNQIGGRNQSSQKAYDYWLKANAQLQSMGIFPLPLPSKLSEYQMSFDIGNAL